MPPGGPERGTQNCLVQTSVGTTRMTHQISKGISLNTISAVPEKNSAALDLPDPLKGPPKFGWFKHYRYHLKQILIELVHHTKVRIGLARQCILCEGSARHAQNVSPVVNGEELNYIKH